MRCAFILILIERSATLMPTPPASMPRRAPGVRRAASEPTAEREPTAPEPDTRPTSYDNKYNWTAKAQAPMGATTAQNRLAALKAAAENEDEERRAEGRTHSVAPRTEHVGGRRRHARARATELVEGGALKVDVHATPHMQQLEIEIEAVALVVARRAERHLAKSRAVAQLHYGLRVPAE